MQIQFYAGILSLLLPLLTVCDSLETAKDLPSPWSYLGCFSDNSKNRTLVQSNGTGYTAGSNMTGKSCVGFCEREGSVEYERLRSRNLLFNRYSLTGLEYGNLDREPIRLLHSHIQ